ncbi:response regulator transcription factor [Oceanirhabdus seepicola]|uniref:Stage 0 sporulation protein A homolog n=1 Tax=Oceanirhabdus seepicola TaxID=2828781 RepID=A0A9J6NZQ5_9CLOT|nr:response regulator transcription factor [Oceanirhabdus seepicola]MCM1989747.1 response regulator transcription factor [Oceanirhabdus seepicola]
MGKKVLIVEDEARIREITSDYFKVSGFEVYEAENGREAMEIFDLNEVDLIILDIMMPELDGWSVCKRIRKKSDVLIIILTARSDEEDKLMGFELGADEYVTKPFSPKVLVARAKTLFKRIEGNVGEKNHLIIIDGIEINKQAYKVKSDNQEIELSPKEYSLFLYLVENKGVVLSREAILNNVWGYDYFGDTRAVDTHIKKLRKKLGNKAQHIKTIIRVGYTFEVNR